VPPKNRVRGHERRDSAQQPAAQAMAEFRETPALVVIEPQPLPLKADLQHTILFAEKRDRVLVSRCRHAHSTAKTNWNGDTVRSLLQRWSIVGGTLRRLVI
jgi:hypothetical protein